MPSATWTYLQSLIKKVKNRTSTGITHTDLVLFLEITGIYHFHILKFDFLKPVRRISRLVEADFFLNYFSNIAIYYK